MSLVTLSEVKDYLNETTTTYDDFLSEQIALFTTAIENYCGRRFESASYTQTYYEVLNEDEDFRNLVLFHYPVITLTSIKEIDSEGNETTLASTEYLLKSDVGYIRRIYSNQLIQWFSNLGVNSTVEVQYTAGYATVPTDVKHVCYELISNRYNKKTSGVDINFGNDVQRVSIPGTISIDFDYTLQANDRKSAYGMFIGNYANVLDFYRSERNPLGEIKEAYIS